MGPLTVRPATAVDFRLTAMPQSRLFVSSVSRRQLARRRRPRVPIPLLVLLALLIVALLAFAASHGGF